MPKKTRYRAPSPNMTLRKSVRGSIEIGTPSRINHRLVDPVLQNGHDFATPERVR
jgi:hypothetical protein